MKWNLGDKVKHPVSGDGTIDRVFYWQSKEESCLRVSFGQGSLSSSTDQSRLEGTGWQKVQ